ncbi:MAG: hypothetical protein JXA64_00035 [Candidatus Fermentibacteraceae bacterium]|nr:hypothetical protein [Candidatus Fermentibacteraceae bacterium]MBN2607472.1 hypothetical protein [Candidatus Fermentibacteraceae bacterium]
MTGTFSLLALVVLTASGTIDGTEDRLEATGLSLAVPFCDGVLAVPWGYGELLFIGPGESPEPFPIIWGEARPCSPPSTSGDCAAICLERQGHEFILLFSIAGESKEYGPYLECGAPVFDGEGSVWFTADGMLMVDGVPTGHQLDAHTISVDPPGNIVVYCDGDDRLCLLETESGGNRILSSCSRFYAPSVVDFGGETFIISSTLEGYICMTCPRSGDSTRLARGSHPFWWSGGGFLLYSVTEDDGHNITSSEIWAHRPGWLPFRMTSSPSVHEIMPLVLNDVLMAIDSDTGSLLTLPQP